jgi:hypothetical protein
MQVITTVRGMVFAGILGIAALAWTSSAQAGGYYKSNYYYQPCDTPSYTPCYSYSYAGTPCHSYAPCYVSPCYDDCVTYGRYVPRYAHYRHVARSYYRYGHW